MTDRYQGKDLIRYLGSVHSAVGLLLFWFGAGALLASAILAVSGFSLRAEGMIYLAIPAWSIVALSLAGPLRRDTVSPLVTSAGIFWLSLALIAALLFRYSG